MILENKVSYFKHTRDTECVKGVSYTIGDFLDRFKNGDYKSLVNKVRSGNSEAKKNLPTIAFHGVFDGWRKKESFVEASGIIILDIDDIEDSVEEVKEEIMESTDHVLSVMKSPSGNGVKVLYYVQPELINADNYRSIGKQIVGNFDIYGKVDFLSVTDTLIATYDPDILINPDAVPDFIYVKEFAKKESELEELDESIPLWDDAEDFFDTVLAESIAERVNNNYHYIQVAVLDLAKFGFYHPEYDLSFVIHYAEEQFKYSSENKGRFAQVAEIAKDYPQQKWAYKLVENEFEGEEDDYIDYSEFHSNDVLNDENSDNEDMFINYDNFYLKVLETAKEGDRVGFEVSYEELADAIRFKGSGIFTWTGIPGHGKTEATDMIILELARLYGHQTLIAGFEQRPEEHVVKLMRKLEGRDIRCPTWLNGKQNLKRFESLYSFITSKIIHIDTDVTGGNINKILEGFAEKIKFLRENGGNPRYVVIDPFNMLSIKGRFSGHEKIEEILRRLTHFSHQMDVMVLLIAHPFKMKKDDKTGVYEIPDFYSVKGSSAFFEMSYHGAVVYRIGKMVLIRILKVKQNNLGEKDADVWFMYDRPSGRYIPSDPDGNELKGVHKDKDWLEKALALEKKNYKQ